MIRTFAALILFGLLMATSQGSDWLGGGYVKSGGSAGMKQYFTDPIFVSPSGHYLSSDPSIRQMQISLDMPRPSATAGLTQPAQTAASGAATGAVGPSYLNAAGRWQIDLADGTAFDLNLYQSGNMVFGKGRWTRPPASGGATATGEIYGSSLRISALPDSGTELYGITIDLSRMPYTGSYAIFRAGAQPQLGGVESVRWSPGALST